MNHRLKKIEKRMATVEEAAKKTAENAGMLEQKVKTISDKQNRTGDKMDKKIEQSERRMLFCRRVGKRDHTAGAR